ncbi:MAG: CotH kinase family protein [Bryobacterales bacterium]|nr:CotH kinase family protein [Bryobacterales bacterium]
MKRTILFLASFAALFAQNPPPHPAWTGDKVHEIRLRFKQADYWDQLTKNYLGTEQDAIYLEASLEWGQYKFDSVGVRFKGNSSYRVSTNKKPFRIKLNEFVKGQKIEGIGAYNLSNGFMDASFVREPLYYEMSRALGLKTPRTNYATLYINDQYWGVYLLGEVVNSDFLKNYFGSKEDTGNLYKGNIGAVFNYLGTDKAIYKEVWEKQTNEEADDWSDLIELCRVIGETPAAELRAKLEPIMDIDSFLTAIALDNATVNLDSYIGMGQNFNVYRRPSDNKWVWIVWDPSLAFGAFGGGGGGAAGTPATQTALEYVQAGGGFGGGGGFPPGGGLPPGGGVPPGAGGGTAVNTTGRPLATKLWDIPEYKERYRQIYKTIVDRIYNAENLVARANTLRAIIRPFLEGDPNRLNTMAQFDGAMTTTATVQPGQPGQPGQGGQGNAPALQPFIQDRLTWLKSQFSAQTTLPSAALTANVTRLTFNGADAPAQTVELKYTGVNTPPTYSVYATTENGGNWLKLNVTSGALPGGFSVSLDAKTLAAGAYEATITAFLGGAAPVTIPVSLVIGTVPAPTLSAVVNAASYNAATIAPGQLVTIFGTNLATPGVKVTFDGVAAQLLYTTANQLGAIVPLSLAGKTQTSIQVTVGAQSSAALNKTVAPSAPGIFTTNASGSGPGAIINQSGTVNGAASPAPKGSIVAIYLTGGGASMAVSNTTVTIGGQSATVAYAGNAPGSVQGLYQVNATVPANAASGALPVVISVAGVASQSGVTVHVQ